jgi:TetR/AcrR family transcriptional regulator, repressor for neighboring sulfatase
MTEQLDDDGTTLAERSHAAGHTDDSRARFVAYGRPAADRNRPRRGRPPKNAHAPHGPDEVTRAVVDVATELFSSHGIGSVSIRQVAAEAGVNPGLVHRYIGSKEDLLRAVFTNFADQLEHGPNAVTASAMTPASERLVLSHQRIIAHLILEGYDITEYSTRSPLVGVVLDTIQRSTAVDEHTARVRMLALGLGWRLFESFLTSATGLGPDDHDEIQEAIRQTNLAIGRGIA